MEDVITATIGVGPLEEIREPKNIETADDVLNVLLGVRE